MRLIDADYVTEKLNEINGTAELDKAFEAVENAPTVCDVEQISSARYNNGFYDGKKAMEEKLEQIRAEIEDLTYYWCEINPKSVIDDVLQIIDKYTKGAE